MYTGLQLLSACFIWDHFDLSTIWSNIHILYVLPIFLFHKMLNFIGCSQNCLFSQKMGLLSMQKDLKTNRSIHFCLFYNGIVYSFSLHNCAALSSHEIVNKGSWFMSGLGFSAGIFFFLKYLGTNIFHINEFF